MKREAKELAQEMVIVGLFNERCSCATLSLFVGSMDDTAGCFFFGPPPLCFPFFLLVDFFFGGMVTIRKTTMPLLPSSFVVSGELLFCGCGSVWFVVQLSRG